MTRFHQAIVLSSLIVYSVLVREQYLLVPIIYYVVYK